MWQTDKIIEKAKKLGLDIDDSPHMADKIRSIAAQLGIEHVNTTNNSEIDNIEHILDEKIAEMESQVSEESGYDDYESTGNKYHARRNSVEDRPTKDERKKRKEELDEKVNKAQEEKRRGTKTIVKRGKNGETSSVTKEKTGLDRVRDNINVARAKKDRFKNKIDNVTSGINDVFHPLQAMKRKGKNFAKKKIKDIGKDIAKGIKKGLKWLWNLIKTNKILMLIVIFIAIFLFILLIMFFLMNSGNYKGSNSYKCNSGLMSINSTNLSKREFVKKIKEYFKGKSGEHVEVFLDNAENIYTTSLKNSINPELVIVRAVGEGFSPGVSKNNYWGLGCYNGIEAETCISYNSFNEGMMAFINNVSQYNSVEDMMMKYAYIGDYWYASDISGATGAGGCYYYPYIKEYMTTSRSSQVNNICSNNNCYNIDGGGSCVATTQEDQEAYAKYQVYSYMKTIRDNIFGPSPTSCNIYTGKYVIQPEDDLYSDLEFLINESFEEFLNSRGTNIEDFNSFLYESIEDAGIGTREGVVTAAVTLIGSLAEMGVKLNYQWGGKYYYLGSNPNWGTTADMSWLCNNYADRGYEKSVCTTNYKWHGFDCSGFVNWAIRNGMQDNSIAQHQTSTSQGISLSSSKAVCKPGGVLVSDGHIVLVVATNDDTKKYTVAEATGSRLSTGVGGVKLSYYNYDASGYVCKNLDEMYGE